MDRIAFAAMLLLALGLWVHPYLSGIADPTANPAASAKTTTINPTPLDRVIRPQAAFAEQPAIKLVRGQPGFWRLAQTTTGVWWFLSPADQLEFLNSVTTVQPYQLGRDHSGIHYISRDITNLPAEPADLDSWAQKTIVRLRQFGFKSIGAWSHPVFHKYDVPIARDLNVSAWIHPPRLRFYDPQWAQTAEYAIQTQVVPLKDNVNLVGYYIDNELDWSDSAVGPAHYFNNLPADDPNRAKVLDVILSLWPTIQDFNRDWQVDLKSWDELANWPELPHQPQRSYSRLASAWLYRLAEDYFRLTCGLIRKYDPNHLILGVRFRGYAPIEVVRASRDYTDAQSINYYVSDARLDLEMFHMMHQESGQPVIITEYSFHSLDNRSGNRNTVGFAAQVLDQQARADGYRLFTTRAARVPFIVGVDWFQWSDEPPSGRASDGEDVNFGIVDVDDNPYELLADAVQQTAPILNQVHATSVTDTQTDVWRQSFADKPTMNVPYLSTPIRLNGELSDWSTQARLAGVRYAQTVGLERSKLPLPNVYLGWTEQGLYLGIEVFDSDVHSTPATGWWWTRDYVEFWIHTRPDQASSEGYDAYSHQFFFVPNAWPGEDGVAGVVGQWHRPGDALKDHLIPHPDIRQAARILPDRYVVEMFIPAKALNGFDPARQPTLAFNLHVRNFQHATDYFWSAPKEVLTQLRPRTWGSIVLSQPDGSNTVHAVSESSIPPLVR